MLVLACSIGVVLVHALVQGGCLYHPVLYLRCNWALGLGLVRQMCLEVSLGFYFGAFPSFFQGLVSTAPRPIVVFVLGRH